MTRDDNRPTIAPIPPALVGVPQLGKMLCYGGRTVYRLHNDGLLPDPVALPSLRWRVAEVQAWCEAGCPSRAMWREMRAAKAAAKPTEGGAA